MGTSSSMVEELDLAALAEAGTLGRSSGMAEEKEAASGAAREQEIVRAGASELASAEAEAPGSTSTTAEGSLTTSAEVGNPGESPGTAEKM